MLGAPIASIDEKQLEESYDYRDELRRVIESHINLEIEGALMHRLGGGGFLAWETNKMPGSTMGFPLGGPVASTSTERRQAIVAAIQYLDNCFATETANLDASDELPEHLLGMAAVTSYLRSKGFDEIRENTKQSIQPWLRQNRG
ncbi:MAG: hypothetical protein AAF497_00660 [Planctomycetota bacterium]